MTGYDDMVDGFFCEIINLRDRVDFYSSWGRSNGRKSIWTCKDGTKIKIMDMADSHIKNAIRLLERKKDNSGALRLLRWEDDFRHVYPNLLRELGEHEQIMDLVF